MRVASLNSRNFAIPQFVNMVVTNYRSTHIGIKAFEGNGLVVSIKLRYHTAVPFARIWITTGG